MAGPFIDTASQTWGKPSHRGRFFRRLGVSLGATLLLLVLVEGIVSVVLAWVDADDTNGLTEEVHCVYDPDLGWINERDRHIDDLYGPHRDLTTNARGFRGTEEVADATPAGRYRILCVGDSFTLGYGVDDADTYPACLEALAPAIQTVNMGQGGYGVDQCYLWYRRDAKNLEANLVVFAFIAPDFERMVGDRFDGLYPKPELRVEGGALVVPREPVPEDWDEGGLGRRLARFVRGWRIGMVMERLHRRQRWARERENAGVRPAPDPLPYAAVGEAMVRDLARLARERGHDLALVLIPLRDRRAGHPAALAAWLAPIAADLDVPFLDLTADFDAFPPRELEFLYQADGHLNPHGNRFLAATLRRRLGAHFPDLP